MFHMDRRSRNMFTIISSIIIITIIIIIIIICKVSGVMGTGLKDWLTRCQCTETASLNF